ncbi:MAG: PAS domain-containing protein [Verrucomicrobiota bacterium]
MKTIFGVLAGLILLTHPAAAWLTEIPPLTNIWELAHLRIVDKDTNGAIANANDLYRQSLQTDFPEITSLSNLVGKTDYYFYPTNQAEKFRADDARVLATGLPFETIEENQPIGGQLNYVYVSKTPLRDAQNQLYALRIQFYFIPPPNQTYIRPATNDWERTQLFIMDKDTNSVFLNGNRNYIASLQASFPQIQSVTNLIGRDDFYFYEPNEAMKYRDDDQQVMTTGIGYQSVEVNQQLGGPVRYVYVSKTPLRDGAGTVFGVHVEFFDLPQLSIAPAVGGLEISWPSAHSVYHLQQAAAALGPWSPLDDLPTISGGMFRVVVPSANRMFYRLIKD